MAEDQRKQLEDEIFGGSDDDLSDLDSEKEDIPLSREISPDDAALRDEEYQPEKPPRFKKRKAPAGEGDGVRKTRKIIRKKRIQRVRDEQPEPDQLREPEKILTEEERRTQAILEKFDSASRKPKGAGGRRKKGDDGEDTRHDELYLTL
ncbi:hypothetical protein HK097_003833, partial [Rhizophlyctis rosea]